METDVLWYGDVGGGGRSGQGQAATASDAPGYSGPGEQGLGRPTQRRGRKLVDRQPTGGPRISSGSTEADDGKPDERLRDLSGRGQRVPRWVPHTTPSSLPERCAWLLAGADDQLASLGGRPERAGPPPAADRGGERRPDDGDDGDDDGVVDDDDDDDRRRDDVLARRLDGDEPRVRRA